MCQTADTARIVCLHNTSGFCRASEPLSRVRDKATAMFLELQKNYGTAEEKSKSSSIKLSEFKTEGETPHFALAS